MGCFAAPATVAIFTTVFRKKIPEKYHINWLNTMLWGGAAGLAAEHVAHGEIVPFPPFLTALNNPADMAAMFQEIATIGLGMVVACTLVWAVMVKVSWIMESRQADKAKQTT